MFERAGINICDAKLWSHLLGLNTNFQFKSFWGWTFCCFASTKQSVKTQERTKYGSTNRNQLLLCNNTFLKTTLIIGKMSHITFDQPFSMLIPSVALVDMIVFNQYAKFDGRKIEELAAGNCFFNPWKLSVGDLLWTAWTQSSQRCEKTFWVKNDKCFQNEHFMLHH